MAWTIRRTAEGLWTAWDLNEMIARTVLDTDGRLAIIFDGAPKFNWTAGTPDQFIGYVRGVERAVQVHAEETRGGNHSSSMIASRHVPSKGGFR